jgi:hypothetical protein
MSGGSLDLFFGQLEYFAERVRALAERDGTSEAEREALLGVALDAEALAPRAKAVEWWCDDCVATDLLEVCTPARLWRAEGASGRHSHGVSDTQDAIRPAAEAPSGQVQPENGIAQHAKAWWESFRPMGWTVEEHLRNPTINTSGESEEALAAAVARWIEADG